jgi:DNA polymerase-1
MIGQMKDLVFLDIETTMCHQKIHLVVTNANGVIKCHREPKSLKKEIWGKILVAHNGIAFDFPVLNKVWGLKIQLHQVLDTLVLSRLLNPMRTKHSLAAWGEDLGFPKTEFNQFDQYSEEMRQYCINDVKVLERVYNQLLKEKESHGFDEESIQLEHEVCSVISKQVSRGFRLDVEGCERLCGVLSGRMEEICERLQESFQPIVHKRVSEKTGKQLKDSIEVFNPASRQQISKRLQAVGWKPKKYTEKGSVIVDESVLRGVNIPEAKLICEYLLLQKRLSQVTSWIEAVSDKHRVHGKVITNGAVTGRMTHHSPNLAQIPSVHAEYGSECREQWVVDPGYKLVGIDASGLELRMLAHYMEDEEYTKEVVDGDIHTKNQLAAGLDTRAKAKTFIYAFLYGAGAKKIGSITGTNGTVIIDKFMKNVPALAKLKEKIAVNLRNKGSLPGLDGRRLFIRSEHAALNTLLQGAGAVVMKKALVIFDKYIKLHELDAHFVANVHDEWQLEVKEEEAELVGQLGVKAIVEAGKALRLNCPLDGEYKVGDNWKQTH